MGLHVERQFAVESFVYDISRSLRCIHYFNIVCINLVIWILIVILGFILTTK